MKKIIFLIIACSVLSARLFGQSKIDKAEWFVDTDPGVGNATLLANYAPAVDSINSVAYNLNLTALNLNSGIHFLFVRGRNTLGQWGLTQFQPFFVTPNGVAVITQAEYFFDTDLGVGNGTALSLTALSDSASYSGGLNVGNLSPGMHYLYVRMKANGTWGLTQFQPFFVTPGGGAVITNAEYFFDTDPGVGLGTAYSPTFAGDSAVFNGSINVGNLSAGLHQLYTRMKSNGQWGLTQFQPFFVTPGGGAVITATEFFFDTDPGVGNGTPIAATYAADSASYAGGISVGALTPGQHYLYIREKSNGQWGLTQFQPFHVTPAAGPVTWHGEYFVDTDPGVGNGSAITAVGSADTVVYTGNINVGNVHGGAHFLYTRFQNANGIWGLTQYTNFYTKPSVVAAEYFFDTDPGTGNGVGIPVVAAGDSAIGTAAISMTTAGLGFGKHWIYVRAKNDLGQWGLTERDSMIVLRPANDHCAGGTLMTLGNGSCGTTISSSTFATDTTGLAVGSCNTSAEQGDVWFKCIVPANGNLEVNISQTALQPLKKGNIQAFTGLCGSLTNVGCANFDSSAIGRLIMTGLTANDTVRVRIMGTNSYDGNFAICAFGFTNALTLVASDSTICNGNNTTLTAAAYSGNTYAWSPATGLSATTGAVVTATPTITTTYTVTATLSNTVLTKSVVIIVTPLTINATASPTTICNGAAATLAATGATTYSWTPGSLTGTSVSVTPSSTTTYTVTGTQGGCNGSTTVVVNVFNDVTPPVISACAGTVNVNNTTGFCYATGVSLGSPTATDNCTATGSLLITNNAPTNFNVGATTVTWTVKDAALNQSTCTSTVNVTDNELPTITCPATVNVNVSNGLCYATGVSLGTSTNNDNCGVLSFSNNAPTNFNVGATTVTWTVIDIHTNQNTCTQTVNVTDNIKPTITCGGTLNLTSSINGCGVLSSTLTNPTANDNCSVVITNNAPTTLPIGTTNVKWYATDPSGNKDSCTQTVNVANATLSITAGSSTSFCNGQNVVLTCNASTGVKWYNGATLISGATSSTYTATASGNYAVQQSVGSCNRTSNSIAVTVNPSPTANAGADTSILTGSSVTLHAAGGGTYSWSNGDTTAASTVSPTSTTTYTVTVTNSFGCQSTDAVIVTVNFSSLAVSPSFYNYGSVVIGNTSSHNITLTNNGTLPVTITSMTTASPMSLSFTSQAIAPGSSLNVPVVFTPTATLIYVKTVTIVTSLGNFNVTLQGTGVNASAGWNISPTAYNFGTQAIGTNTVHNFTITNTGNVVITIGSHSSTNSVFTGNNPLTIVPVGGTAVFNATFHPTAITTSTGVMTINTPTSGLSPLTINLTGTGYSPGTPPVLQYSSASPYNGSTGVNPTVGQPGTYTYNVVYKSATNKAPQVGYPALGIDKNADGDFIDAGEGVFAMTKVGGSSNWTTGETYTYSTTLTVSNNYGYQFFANDTLGNAAVSINNTYQTGPLVTNQTLDLSIYASDINFSINHPAANQPFTIYATVHNNSPYSASNVNMRFYNDSIYFTQTTLPYIGPNSTATVSLNWVFNPDGWYPVKVWIDSAHTLTAETNVLNNYAIRPILVGNFTIPASLNVTASAAPQGCPAGALISGNATYAGLNLVGTPPVLGGTVTVTILGVNYTCNTATDGSWSIFIPLPCGITYSYTVACTDYTLTGNQSAQTFTVPCVNCNGGGGGGSGGSGNAPAILSNSSAPACIINNASFLFTIPLSNYGNASAYHDTTFVYADGILGYTHRLDSIIAGQNVTYTDAFVLTTGNHTMSYVNHYYNSSNALIVSSGSTVVNVQANQPDLYLGYFQQTTATAFTVRNYDGSCVNAPISKTYIYDSMSTYPNRILLDSITSPAVPAGTFVNLNYNRPSWTQGYHYLVLETDGRHIISELNETNNTINAVVYVPLPELIITRMQVSNSNVQTGNSINYLAVVHNIGATAGAFKVRFKVNGVDMGNKINVSGILAGDSALVVSDLFSVTAATCPDTILAIADIDNQVGELDELNNGFSYLFGRDLTSGLTCTYNNYPLGAVCNPYVVSVGGTINMTTQVFNYATRDADTVNVSFKIGTTLIGTDNLIHVAAGASVTTYITHTFPTVGSYAIAVYPDYDSKYCELDETNNIGYIYVNVVSGLPDLVILSQDISPSNLNPNPGQNISIVCSVHNTGTIPSSPCHVRFYVDNVQLGADVPMVALYPGQDTTVAATALYSNTIVGPKIVKVKADISNIVTELAEYNNEATRAIIVGGAPDLSRSINEGITFFPSTFRKGDTIKVRDYIRNFGGDTGTAKIVFYDVSPAGVYSKIDSMYFTMKDHDSSRLAVNWIVSGYGGKIVTQISNSNPPEYNVFNNTDSTNFTAGPKLLPHVTVSSNVICANSATTFNSTVNSDGQAVTYAWYKSGSANGQTGTGFSIALATIADSGVYTIHATDAFGTVTAHGVHLTVKPLPTVNATAPTGNICASTIVSMSATGATSYSWSPGALSGSTVSVTPTVPITYTVTGTANGCSGTATVSLNIIACGGIPQNDDPCTGISASSNSGHIAGYPTLLYSYDGGSAYFNGIANNPTANPPSGPNLVYYTGSTLAAGNLGVNEPAPPCGILGTSPKSVWYKFRAPTMGGIDLFIRTGYTATTFSTIISAWIVNGNPCAVGGATYTNIGCTTTGTLFLPASSLATLSGQFIYVQLVGTNSTAGNYMMSVQGVASSISLSNATSASLTANIPSVAGATSVVLRWTPVGGSGYSQVYLSPTTTNYIISGLNSGVNYSVWATYLNATQTFYSQVVVLSTVLGCSTSPVAPVGNLVTGHCSRVMVTWPAHPMASTIFPYRLYWRVIGASGFNTIATTTNNYNLTGLALNTTYEFFYKVICTGGGQVNSLVSTYTTCTGPAKESNPNVGSNNTLELNGRYFINADFTEIATYADNSVADGEVHEITLNEVGNEEEVFGQPTQQLNTANNGSIQLIPNPTSNEVMVNYQLANESTIIIRLTDIQGKTIQEQRVENPSRVGAVQFDLADVSAGVYLVTIQSDVYRETKKLVIAK